MTTPPAPKNCSRILILKSYLSRLLGVLIGFGFVSCAQIRSVDLDQLTARPARYDGQKIRIRGFMHHEFEDYTLFRSADASHRVDWPHAISLSYHEVGKVEAYAVNKDADIWYFDHKYVTLIGRYEKPRKLPPGFPQFVNEIFPKGYLTVDTIIEESDAPKYRLLLIAWPYRLSK